MQLREWTKGWNWQAIVVLMAGLVVLCACAPLSPAVPGVMPTLTAPPATLALTAAPTLSPVPTGTPLPTVAPSPTVPSSPWPTAGARPQGWKRFTQAEYGFSFEYPPDWALKEDLNQVSTSYRHLFRLSPPANPAVTMVIGYKRQGEEIGIQRTGVGSGELVQRGSVMFLGQALPRQVLVANKLDMSVLYNNAAEIRRGELVFVLSLDFTGPPSGPTALTAALQQQADWIVESFISK